MKTIQEQIEVMQHFAAGGKVEYRKKGSVNWIPAGSPAWNWDRVDFRIAEYDPYAELKAAAQEPTKQIKCNDSVGIDWQDAGFEWKWCCAPHCYEIRDKPKQMKKVKMLAWLYRGQLMWLDESRTCLGDRAPAEDKEIEVEE